MSGQLTQHKHVIEFIATFRSPDLGICIVMEYASGGDLSKVIRSAQAKLLEAQLAGLTVPNVLADALGMLVVLVLWRRVVIRNDWLL